MVLVLSLQIAWHCPAQNTCLRLDIDEIAGQLLIWMLVFLSSGSLRGPPALAWSVPHHTTPILFIRGSVGHPCHGVPPALLFPDFRSLSLSGVSSLRIWRTDWNSTDLPGAVAEQLRNRAGTEAE